MAKLLATTVLSLLLLNSIPVNAQRPGDPPRERLGVRVSFIGTTGKLRSHLGDGYDFTLYFTEKLFHSLYLEVQIGATYLGDVRQVYIGEKLTGYTGIASEMRLAYLTLGPQYTWQVSETFTWYASLGGGIYTVSMLFDTGIQAFDLSDQHFGVGGGVGFFWRITDNWNIEVGGGVNKIWTDQNDLYYIFTEGGNNPWVYSIGSGIAMNLR